MHPWKGIKACAFDAYGTLFDVHSAVARHQARLGPRANEVSALWRRKQLEYTWLRSLMRDYADFWQVTGDALDYALAHEGVRDSALRETLLQAYLELDCYEDVTDALRALRQAGLKTAILSNGSPEMLRAATEAAGLDAYLDGILSVDAAGVFKPAPEAYGVATTALRLKASEIVFLSSNAWDIAGAASFGFPCVWINRFGQIPERLPHSAATELQSLGAVAQTLAH